MPVIPIVAATAAAGGAIAWLFVRRRPPTEEEILEERTPRSPRSSAKPLLPRLLLILGLVLVVGLMFDAFDRGTAFARFDNSVAVWGAENATGTSVRILDLLTSLGGTPVVTALATATGIYGLVRYRSWSIPLYIALVAGGQALVNNGLKWVVSRERPTLSQLADWSGSSFPSGHSAAAAASYAGIALVLMLGRSERARTALIVAAVTVAISVAATRAVLGVHWLTDIIAGVAVGWAWFLVVTALFGDHFETLEPVGDRRSASIGGARDR